MICGISYCVRYFFNKHPPKTDYLSPLVSLSLAVYAYTFENGWGSTAMVLILVIEAFADYHMGPDVRFPIFMFSIGHLFKQFIIISLAEQTDIFVDMNIVLSFPLVLCIGYISIYRSFVSCGLLDRPTDTQSITKLGKISMVLYAYLLMLTMIQISLHIGTVVNGFALFIISDLLLLINDLHPFPIRQMRVLLVPALYWLSQYFTIHDLSSK